MLRFILLLAIFLQSCCWWSCDDEPSGIKDEWNDQGTQISKKYLWKVPLYFSYKYDSWLLVYAGANLYYKNGYFVGSLPAKGKSYYEFREIETGKLIWQIPNDVVNSRGYPMSIKLNWVNTYQYQHYVVAMPYYPICFNLKTGKIQWRLENAKYWEFIDGGFEDKIFFEREYEKDTYALYEADILTGSHQEVIRFDIHNGVARPKLFRDKKNDLLFILPVENLKKNETYLGLYNYTQKKWIYKDILTKTKGGHILIYKDKIFLLHGHGFSCHRLSTGKEIWSDSSYNTAVNSGPSLGGIMVDNKLIVAMGDDFLMCLNMDANYKDIIWENHKYGVGNSVSPFHILNGVIYFADGGGGRICAIDPHTGKFLWFLKSPDLHEYGRGAFFKGDIWVIPGKDGKKGRIITSTYRSGVCYEAIR